MTIRRPLIETVITLLTDNYVFPDIAEQAAAVLRRNDYDHLVDDSEFASVVTSDLQSINGDKHLRLLHERPRPQTRTRQHCFEKVEILDGNVGYLEITLLRDPREFGDIAAAAMTLIADTDGLILDLRRNRGGDPAMVALICAYVLDEFTHLNDLHVRRDDLVVQFWTSPYVPGRRFGGSKPIWVLTSSTTFSGGEELAYDLQQLGRATIIGEATRGGAHPSTWHRITEQLFATIPDARAINPVTKTNWEGVGVTPDIRLPAEEALDHARGLARNAVTPPSSS
jgi:C-terminal processing protease CtpA/Prc